MKIIKTAMGKPKKNQHRPSLAEQADKHILYEQSVQDVEAEIDFVDAMYLKIRGKQAGILREDFCGTTNTSCEWIKRRKTNIAHSIDLDPHVLEWGKRRHHAELTHGQSSRIHVINDNVLEVSIEPVDIILAMNFSYWIFKTRETMKAYFHGVYRGLKKDGIFFLDVFGGYEAFEEMEEITEHDDFTYIWDQAHYNPITGNYICHIHFRFQDGSKIKKAFTYDWRLWTIPELTEMLKEAGFMPTVYWDKAEDDDDENEYDPSTQGEADAGWIAYIAAAK